MIARRIGRIAAWLAVVGWMAVIFALSNQTAAESSALSGGLIEQVAQAVTPGFEELPPQEQTAVVDQWQNAVRKLAHAAEFAVLGVLLWVALSRVPRLWIRAAIAAGISLLYAISDEGHQFFVAGRGPGALDVCIDLAGALAGVGLALAATALWRKRKNHKKA
ncbi:MAG: VanZ family protein [Acutalibacteraceae bacterium]|jgi:VanZ family protein